MYVLVKLLVAILLFLLSAIIAVDHHWGADLGPFLAKVRHSWQSKIRFVAEWWARQPRAVLMLQQKRFPKVLNFYITQLHFPRALLSDWWLQPITHKRTSTYIYTHMNVYIYKYKDTTSYNLIGYIGVFVSRAKMNTKPTPVTKINKNCNISMTLTSIVDGG